MNHQTKMKVVCVLLLLCHGSSTVKHSLKFFLTVSNGVQEFPEFVASVQVDEVEGGRCDSSTNKIVLQKWAREFLDANPQQLEWYSQECLGNQFYLKARMDFIMKNLNQSGGSHTLQLMSGCEWDDETGQTASFAKYGYDGEDFLEVDLQTMKWTALKPEALTTKLSWDTERAWLAFMKGLYIDRCPNWLKAYVNYGKAFLQRTELPSVYLLQKSPSSPVTCFATGFYPNRAAMFWRKDGEELYEDVEHGEILPNCDDAFQMRADLNISAIKPEDWGRYECVFQLDGVKKDLVAKLFPPRTPEIEPPSASPVALVCGLVAGLLLLIVCITGIFIWRRNINKFQPVSGGQEIPEEEAETTS